MLTDHTAEVQELYLKPKRRRPLLTIQQELSAENVPEDKEEGAKADSAQDAEAPVDTEQMMQKEYSTESVPEDKEEGADTDSAQDAEAQADTG